VAPFVDNVADYVSSRADVESTLRSFQEMISKYQFMEMNTQRRSVGLREKIPDIKKTLDMVKFLKLRRDNASENSDDDEEDKDVIETHFELNDTLYARAKVSAQDTEEVYLWLGANVMLAYPIGEAETMLVDKLQAAELSLSNCEEDLEFLREQITVRPLSFSFFGVLLLFF
jgi:prefoldin subunit 5